MKCLTASSKYVDLKFFESRSIIKRMRVFEGNIDQPWRDEMCDEKVRMKVSLNDVPKEVSMMAQLMVRM